MINNDIIHWGRVHWIHIDDKWISWAVIVIFTFVFFLSRHFPVGKKRRLVTLFYFEFISDLKKLEIEGRGNEFEILHIKKQKCSIPEEMQCL